MKLRLENNHICFRISREELDILIAERAISSCTIGLSYSVKIDEKAKSTLLNYSDNNFTLTLPPQVVIEHREALPSKEGIVEEVNTSDGSTIIVSLEVDVRSRHNKNIGK